MNEILLPNYLYIGGDSIKKIIDILSNLNCKRPIVITDNTMVDLNIIKPLEELLTSMQIRYTIYKDTIPEPTAESIKEAVDLVRKEDFDCIIAFGGGSPIDSAKAISALSKFGGKIADYKFPYILLNKGIPITKFTIITDENTDEKMLCLGAGFMPTAAIVDYKLSLTVPKRTSADTGIDALTHAIEAYVSKKANIFSDTQAISAMKLIYPNLRKVYEDGNNLLARENVMVGATLAGMAFSNASVALVHGMSRPIGAFYHVPHGLSNAMLLPTITDYSLPAASLRYSQCSKAMGISENNEEIESANKQLIDELYNLNKDLDVPTPKEFGINKNDFMEKLDIMATQALDSGSPNNNPRIPSHQEIKNLYEKLWN